MITMQTRMEADVAVLSLEGTLDGGPESRRIQEQVKDLLRSGTRKIVLDLSSVPWANSLGAGVLIASYVSAIREDAAVRFCGLSDRVTMVLRASDLIPGVFETFDSEPEAVQSFSESTTLKKGRS